MFLFKKKPIIFSAIKPKDPWGGSFIFTKHLLNYLKKTGWKVTFNPNDRYDVAYASGWFLNGANLDKVLSKAPLLYRMDGLTSLYRNKVNEQTNRQESWMQSQAEKAAHIVFQSQFCVESCAHWNVKEHSVIINGTDLKLFHPPSPRKKSFDKINFISVSWSNNLNKGMPLFKELAESMPQHNFMFMGNWPQELDPGPVTILPAKQQKHLADFMRQGDVFVHLALNDPCPNVVVEALASGLFPVISNTGGAKEIVEDEGYIWQDLNTFRSDFEEKVLPKLPLTHKNIERLSLENVGKQYLNIINQIRNEK